MKKLNMGRKYNIILVFLDSLSWFLYFFFILYLIKSAEFTKNLHLVFFNRFAIKYVTKPSGFIIVWVTFYSSS